MSLGTEFDGTEPWREIVPYEQDPDDFFSRMYQNITLAVRTAGEPATVTAGFRGAVKDMDPNRCCSARLPSSR